MAENFKRNSNNGNGKSQWARAGQILLSKQNKLYIKMDKDVQLSKGDILFIKDPRVSVQEGVAAGRLTEERGQEILSKIPDFVRYELQIAPPQK